MTLAETRAAAYVALVGSCLWGVLRGGLYVVAALIDARWPEVVIPAEANEVYSVARELLPLWVWGLLTLVPGVVVLMRTRGGRWRALGEGTQKTLSGLAVLQIVTALTHVAAVPLSPAWATGAVAGMAGLFAAVVLGPSPARS